MKIGIVVPFSWSFWGAVVEHAELQAAALRGLGHEVRLIMGNDPPRSVHPGAPPARRPARGAATRGDPDRTVRDRPGERLAAEHHPQPPLHLPDPARARAGALRSPPPARADDPDPLHRGARALGRADGGHPPRERRRSAGCGSRPRSGASSRSASTDASPSPSRRGCRPSAGFRASTRSSPTAC